MKHEGSGVGGSEIERVGNVGGRRAEPVRPIIKKEKCGAQIGRGGLKQARRGDAAKKRGG